jgi:hypothetical protein
MSRTLISIGTLGPWEFDDEELTLKDAFAIKSATGLGVVSFLNGIADMDPDCLQTLIWLVRSKDQPGLRRESIQFRLADVSIKQVGDADPTSGSVTPSSDGPSTSTSSRASSASARRKSTR